MTTTTKDYAGIIIYLRMLSAEELFSGAEDLSETDVEKSHERYYDLLAEAVAARYPGATVQATRHPSYFNSVDGPRSMDATVECLETALFRPQDDPSSWVLPSISDDLWERGEFWIAKVATTTLYTNAPAAYDYEGIVLASEPVGRATASSPTTWDGPWRRLTVTEAGEARQIARNASGLYATLHQRLFDEEIAPNLEKEAS